MPRADHHVTFPKPPSFPDETRQNFRTPHATQIRVEFPGFQYDNDLGKPAQKRLAAIGYCEPAPANGGFADGVDAAAIGTPSAKPGVASG